VTACGPINFIYSSGSTQTKAPKSISIDNDMGDLGVIESTFFPSSPHGPGAWLRRTAGAPAWTGGAHAVGQGRLPGVVLCTSTGGAPPRLPKGPVCRGGRCAAPVGWEVMSVRLPPRSRRRSRGRRSSLPRHEERGSCATDLAAPPELAATPGGEGEIASALGRRKGAARRRSFAVALGRRERGLDGHPSARAREEKRPQRWVGGREVTQQGGV
jgi:hypothetical protein